MPTSQHSSPFEPTLEAGIAALVDEFVAQKAEDLPLPSIAQRREGYEASVALAGESPQSVTFEELAIGHIRLRIYRRDQRSNQPMAVYFHGGCFVSGSFTTHHQQLATLAQLSDAMVVAVSYRLAPEFLYPAAHNDAFDATQWIYENAHVLGGDALNITLIGDSAGGHLALATCLRLKLQAEWLPKQQILIYPMLDPFGCSESYQTFGDDYVITRQMLLSGFELYASGKLHLPELNLLQRGDLAGLPVTHILTAECDPLRDEGEKLYALLTKQGVEAHCQRYLGVIHGFFQLAGVSQAARQSLRHVALLIKSTE